MSGPRERVVSAVGKALASVGHELNNVVGVLQSYASFIQEASKDEGVLADVQVIRSTTDKAAVLARQLLAFGHPREREAEALDLRGFVTDAHGFLRRSMADSSQLAVEIGREPALVLVRRAELGRVLFELVLLLEPLLATGSTLTLGGCLTERRVSNVGQLVGEVWLRERRSQESAAPNPPQLEPFRAWAEEQGGELDVAFTSTSGLSVSLFFPALDAPEAQPSVPPKPSNPAESRGSETVLVVEEDAELRLAMCRMLEAVGYRALEAEDAEVARSLGLDGGVVVDLLVTSGTVLDAATERLAEELRNKHPHLSSLRHLKPFSSADLQLAVRAALDEQARLSHTSPADGERVLALVVDDDEHVRLALSRILSDVGADVVTAPSGLHALRKLEALPIDLVIADQLMPGMDGTRLLESAYRTWPRVVRVVYTGYLSSGLVVDAVNRANVHKVLAKDMSPEALRDELGEVVSEIRAARAK